MTDWFWFACVIIGLALVVVREKRMSYREGVWDALNRPSSSNVVNAVVWWERKLRNEK